MRYGYGEEKKCRNCKKLVAIQDLINGFCKRCFYRKKKGKKI